MYETRLVSKELPETFEMYDVSGKGVMVSEIVMTNQGLAVYKDGEWVTVDWDVRDVCQPMSGVVAWAELEDLV